jgi:hypothetical protein
MGDVSPLIKAANLNVNPRLVIEASMKDKVYKL